MLFLFLYVFIVHAPSKSLNSKTYHNGQESSRSSAPSFTVPVIFLAGSSQGCLCCPSHCYAAVFPFSSSGASCLTRFSPCLTLFFFLKLTSTPVRQYVPLLPYLSPDNHVHLLGAGSSELFSLFLIFYHNHI